MHTSITAQTIILTRSHQLPAGTDRESIIDLDDTNWGEPERAPHRRVACSQSIYYYKYKKQLQKIEKEVEMEYQKAYKQG